MNETITEQFDAAIAYRRTPAGLANSLRNAAHHATTAGFSKAGLIGICRNAAERLDAIAEQQAADAAYTELGKLTVEMYRCDPKHWRMNFPLPMVDAINTICTGAVDAETGLLQHPGETCPVHDSETGNPVDKYPPLVRQLRRTPQPTDINTYTVTFLSKATKEVNTYIINHERMSHTEHPANGMFRRSVRCSAAEANEIQAIDGVIAVGR